MQNLKFKNVDIHLVTGCANQRFHFCTNFFSIQSPKCIRFFVTKGFFVQCVEMAESDVTKLLGRHGVVHTPHSNHQSVPFCHFSIFFPFDWEIKPIRNFQGRDFAKVPRNSFQKTKP